MVELNTQLLLGEDHVALKRRSIIRRVGASVGAAALLTGVLAPAANAYPLNELGQPTPEFRAQVEAVLDSGIVPEDAASTIEAALGFLAGDGEPGIDIPQDGTEIAQFVPPMVAQNCANGVDNSYGLATSVPGPEELPLYPYPPGEGQTGFIFTGIGTQALAENQQTEMTVHWINPLEFSYGSTTLEDNGLNPDGPGTVNGVGDTGTGLIFAVIEGGITAAEEVGDVNCQYTPSAAVIPVGIDIPGFDKQHTDPTRHFNL